MKKKIGICLIAAILAGTVFVGCDTEQEQKTGFSVTTGNDVQIKQPKHEITLSMHIPETLNPLYNRDASVDRILKLIYLPLIAQDANGKPKESIAKSWVVSEDGMMASLQLQEGMTWQNGSPVTADDVVFSFHAIQNSAEDAVYRHVTDYVASCTKTGQNSVNIWFREPFSGNLSALYFPVISAEYYKGQTEVGSDVNMKPMGNGPYQMEQYTMASSMTLIPNQSYREGVAKIPKMIVKITGNDETDGYSFSQGILDVMVADATDAGKYMAENESLKSYPFDSGVYDFIGFQFDSAVFQEKTVRQAVAYVVPKDYIYESVYLQYANMTNSPVSPQSWLYEENVAPYHYDPAMAATILKNAGWKDTNNDKIPEKTTEDGAVLELRATILVNQENTARMQIASKLAEELKALGFSITIDAQPYDVYAEKFATGKYDMVVGGWRMSEVPNLSAFFGSKGMYNYIHYQDENMDALLYAANHAVTEGQTLLAYSNLQKKFAEELPYISIAYRQDILLTSEDIAGEITPNRINPYDGIVNWTIGKDTKS